MLRECAAFVSWFMLEYPQFLKPGAFADTMKQLATEATEIRGRRQFRMLLDRRDMWPETD
jgi:hypothetical protein